MQSFTRSAYITCINNFVCSNVQLLILKFCVSKKPIFQVVLCNHNNVFFARLSSGFLTLFCIKVTVNLGFEAILCRRFSFLWVPVAKYFYKDQISVFYSILKSIRFIFLTLSMITYFFKSKFKIYGDLPFTRLWGIVVGTWFEFMTRRYHV